MKVQRDTTTSQEKHALIALKAAGFCLVPTSELDRLHTVEAELIHLKEQARAARLALSRLSPELSRSEVSVVEQLLLGKNGRETAQALYITIGSVNFHRANVYRKLGVSGALQVAAWYRSRQKKSETEEVRP